MNRKRKKLPVKSSAIYILVILLMSLAAYGYQKINNHLQISLATFKLEDIDIKGNNILSEQDVLKLCGLKQGKEQLLKIRPVDIVTKLKKSHYIKGASAVRSLPSTLRIVIVEREPIAFIHGKGLNLVDDEGMLMPIPENNHQWNLPFITGVKEPLGELGSRTTSKKALRGIEMLSYLKMMVSPIEELISELDMGNSKHLKLLLVKGGAEVYMNYDNYQDNLYYFAQYLENYIDWNQLKNLAYIDIRFKDQLIVKEKKS
ncbi:MAG: cell division protein FtsQ/DivIB [Calditrichaceae bacterium]